MIFFTASFQRRVLSISLCIGELILQGFSDQRFLNFILLQETGNYSPIFTYLPRAEILLSCYIFTVNYQETILYRKG